MLAPDVPYFLVLPALVAGILGVAAARRPSWWGTAIAAPAIVAAVLQLPIAWLLYDAMGTVLLPVSAALFAILFALILPAAPREFARRLALVASILSLLLAVAAAFSPPFSRDNPKHENVVLLADEEKAQWIVEGSTLLEPAFRAAAVFSAKPESPFPWLPRYKAFVAPAPAIAFEPPRLEGVRIEGKTLGCGPACSRRPTACARSGSTARPRPS